MGEEKKDKPRIKGSAKFQVILILIFGVVAAWTLYRPTVGFNTEDKYPDLIPLTPQKLIDFGGSPSKVYVGMYIRDLPEVDTVNGIFVADLTIWFKFDPTFIPLEQISKFSFDSATIKDKSKPYTRIEGNKLIAHYDMRVKFSVNLNYKYFPFDDHRVSFSLTNHFLAPSEALFKSSKSNLMINKEISIAGWNLTGKNIKTGYIADTLDPNDSKAKQFRPRVIFSIDLARAGIRHVITILLPLILIFFISLFTLAFDPYGHNSSNIISISIATVTAVIAHKFVIESMSPRSGTFMISDNLFVLFLLACGFVFVTNIFTKNIKGIYKDILAFAIVSFTLISLIYTLKPLF